jgi:ABC-2 type transport system permease protein
VRTAADIEHPARLAAGRYDLMFFIVYLWPLILLSLCLSILTQDRESRRLRNLRLQGVRAGGMLVAQVGARALAATATLLLACAVSAFAIGAVPATGAGVAALAAWSLVAVVYSAFWASVAMGICALCANRTSGAFAAFGAWLVFTVVLPGLLGTAVQLGAPVPGRETYVQAMRDAGDRVDADKVGNLARFYDSHPEWKPVRTSLDKVSSSVARIPRAQAVERAMAGVDARFDAARRRRAALFDRLMGLSPVTIAHRAFARLSGNDEARHRRFIAEVERHHARLRDFFQQAIQKAARADETSQCPRTCLAGYGFRDFAAVPRFAPASGLLQAPPVPWQAGVLCLWAVALGALAWRVPDRPGRE